jgi:hypothetical protein
MSRLQEAEARMRALESEIFQLKRFGRDRFKTGDVIRFNKTYDAQDGTGKTYTYAVVKTPSGWSLTGQHRKTVYTYDELIEFVVQHPTATDVQVATAWIDVTETAEDVLTADMPAGHAPVVRASAVRGETQYSYVDPASLK